MLSERLFPSRARSRGQAAVEYIVMLPLLLLLLLGIVQFGLMFVAKTALDLAAFDGARNGAVENASATAIRSGIAEGLLPLYDVGIPETNTITYAQTLEDRAYVDTVVANPLTVRIQVLNPTPADFQNFGTTIDYLEPNGQMGTYQNAIPNARLLYNTKTAGNVTIQDANVLRIRVDYCYHLIVPFVNTIIDTTMKLDPGSAWDLQCYEQGGVPLVADGTALMQSPAVQSELP
jgi:uncharacterized protein (UPF0333 family)